MDVGDQIGLFDDDSDSSLYKHKLALEKIRNELIDFGLTKSQAKVFIYLGKYGSKTASEIAKALQLPRTETYHLVNSLQNMGLVVAELVHPTRYTAMAMDKAIATLVKQEQEKVDSLATKEELLSQMWKQIPFFAVDTDESKSEKMQLLHGTGPITNKIKEMIITNTEDFRIYGNVSDFHRMYHADVFDMTQDMNGNLKMIISPTLNKPPEFLEEFDSKNLKVVPSNSDNICVIINDKKEALIFMRNTTHPTRQLFAWWSDSDTLIDMMITFFELSWEKGQPLY